MTPTHYRRQSLRTLLCIAATALPASVSAQSGPVFDGCGLRCGLEAIGRITGILQGDLPSTLTGMIARVLSFMGLLATIMVIAAGILLMVSGGDEDRKERAKRMISYTLIGLAVILFARVLVSLVTVYLPATL